jgi:hypothetical protein
MNEQCAGRIWPEASPRSDSAQTAQATVCGRECARPPRGGAVVAGSPADEVRRDSWRENE